MITESKADFILTSHNVQSVPTIVIIYEEKSLQTICFVTFLLLQIMKA